MGILVAIFDLFMGSLTAVSDAVNERHRWPAASTSSCLGSSRSLIATCCHPCGLATRLHPPKILQPSPLVLHELVNNVHDGHAMQLSP